MAKPAKRYQVVLNQHLVGEILDRMGLYGSARGVVTGAVSAASLAIGRVGTDPEKFHKLFLDLYEARSGREVTLAELMLILDDEGAIQDVRDHGRHFQDGIFGSRTQEVLREFCQVACAEVDHGLFRH